MLSSTNFATDLAAAWLTFKLATITTLILLLIGGSLAGILLVSAVKVFHHSH